MVMLVSRGTTRPGDSTWTRRVLATFEASPGSEGAAGMLAARDVQAIDTAAGAHLFGNELLVRLGFDRFLGDLIGECRGDRDDAVAVAQHDVACVDRQRLLRRSGRPVPGRQA